MLIFLSNSSVTDSHFICFGNDLLIVTLIGQVNLKVKSVIRPSWRSRDSTLYGAINTARVNTAAQTKSASDSCHEKSWRLKPALKFGCFVSAVKRYLRVRVKVGLGFGLKFSFGSFICSLCDRSWCAFVI